MLMSYNQRVTSFKRIKSDRLLGPIPIMMDAEIADIGVEKDSRPPRPPNRACGSPAHGSPVSGFLIGIGSLSLGLRVM